MSEYLIHVEPDGDTLLITCPALPEVTTFAENAAMVPVRARAAIEEAITARRSWV
jgi:antitoxin HicB